MESIWSILDVSVILIFLVVFLLCYVCLSSDSNLPPGPRGLPFLGNIDVFKKVYKERKSLHLILNEMRREYGDIIMLRAGGQRLVYVHGYEAIQEAFVKHADVLSDRPSWLKSLKEALKEGKGVVWQSGGQWRATRKIVIQALRNFGVGKTSLEQKIFQEIDAATDYLHNTKGQTTEMRHLISMIIVNVVHGILFDKRYDYEDEVLQQILQKLSVAARHGQGGQGIINLGYSWLMRIFNKKGYEVTLEKEKTLDWIKSFVYDHIKEHKSTFNTDNIRDFIDLYLQTERGNSEEDIHNAGNMFRVILDLFTAGSETTSNTINWCILFMQEYSDIQRKCREVIQETCGHRNVTWSDRGKMPYVEAVLLEVQRHGNTAPVSVPHTTERDVTLFGYRIPRHTLVTANLYSSNMDPKQWNEPHVFNPDRFLESGKLTISPAFIPFSIGPRACLGVSLAKMVMFLTFTNLLQRFRFEKGDLNIKHTFEPSWKEIISAPLPYKTRAIPC